MYNAFKFLTKELLKSMYEGKIMNARKVLLISILAVLVIFSNTIAIAGTIMGTITYDGEVPKFREIKMDADPICLSKHGDKVFPQTLVLGPDKTMGNVFVYIKSGLPKEDHPIPANPAVLSQQGCMYDPHVIGIMVGQSLKILNPDGTLHNVHALSKANAEFNLAMPKFRKEATRIFNKEEFMFPIKCDVHPWMSAWISIMSHPYFDITDVSDGMFKIKNVPAGVLEIEAWHEKLGTQTQKIKVDKYKKSTVDFVFSRP